MSLEETPLHAPSEPPLDPAIVGGGFSVKAPQLDQRRVVIRLHDGEMILVGGTPSHEDALGLARETILKLDVPDGEWPLLGDRFINPAAIVSVDVLRWN